MARTPDQKPPVIYVDSYNHLLSPLLALFIYSLQRSKDPFKMQIELSVSTLCASRSYVNFWLSLR